MPLAPDYGQTPLDHDELDALLPDVADIVGTPITRAAVYDVNKAFRTSCSMS